MKSTEIIDEIVKTEKTNHNVRIVIPALIRWAEQGEFTKTYEDVYALLGYETYSGIGKMLGTIHDIIDKLSKVEKQDIPTLNSLCKKKKSKLPSKGFSIVSPKYEKLDIRSKRLIISGLDQEAHDYPNWDWVLKALGLKPAAPVTELQLNSMAHSFKGGGEGKEHKALKEYILAHPETIVIQNVTKSESEYLLPSGDRLDVYFELENGNRIAIEVKPSTSPESDICRGIFQCVKYTSILDAIRKVTCGKYEVRSLLITSGSFTDINRTLAKELDIEYKEGFAIV